MPMYMQRTPAGFLFRRAIPKSLHPVLKKREIKIPLGHDYAAARRRSHEEAVNSDLLFDDARRQLTQRETIASNRYAVYDTLTPVRTLTDDLKQQLHAYWLSLVDAADQERRAAPKDADSTSERSEFRSEAKGMLDLLKAAWRDGDIDPFLPALHTTLAVRGYRLDIPIDDQRRLCLQFLRAALAGYRLLEARDDGDDPALNLPTLPLLPGHATTSAASPPPAKDDTTLYSLFEYWRDGVPGREQKTIDDVEKRICDLDALCGGKPATALTKADVIAYRDARIKEGRKPRTVEKDISFIKAALQFAADSDKLAANPAAGVKVAQAKASSLPRHLDHDDLKTIFGSPIYTAGKRPLGGAGDAAAWLPIMALYTGARLEELCQLTLDDIKTSGDITYLRLLDLYDEEAEKDIKRLKTEGSRRNIPLAPALIAHGFLDYVAYRREQKETWLFPALVPDKKYGRRGSNWSKWWGRWRKALGVAGRERCFHAFRHSFKTACRAAGIDEEVHDALTGHSGGGIGRDYGHFPLAPLATAVCKLGYPELLTLVEN